MRDIFQKVLNTVGVVMPTQILSASSQNSCIEKSAVDFITPSVLTSPTWLYYAGINSTYDGARNFLSNKVHAGVLGGGSTANIYTDHGAGAIFWTAGGGHYNRSELNLTPENVIVREKMVADINPELQRIATKAIGGPENFEKIVGIPDIAYFPEDNADVLAQLLALVTRNATYSIIYPDATSLGINTALAGFPEWKLIDHINLGKGNAGSDGYPEENGSGFMLNVWMYGV